MRAFLFKIFLLPAVLTLAAGCQKTWHRQAALQQTSLEVSGKVKPDPAFEKTIAPYRAKVEQQMNEVIGVAPLMLGKAPLESPVGNFVADLQRTQAEKLTGKPVDMGLMTSGGLRTTLGPGNVTVGSIFELMPFENELYVITVTAPVVQQLLTYASQPHIAGSPLKVLSTSNVTYAIAGNQPQQIMVGGLPLDSARTYTIALSDYLANGGDNLEFLKNPIATQKTGKLLRQVIIDHVKELTAQGKQVEGRVEGRVILADTTAAPVPVPVPETIKPKR